MPNNSRDILRLIQDKKISVRSSFGGHPSGLTKYNQTKEYEYNGHSYMSKLECNTAVELDRLLKDKIVAYWEPQPKFVLIPSFKRDNKTYRETTYSPDFYVKWTDGHEEYLDSKGFQTEVFRLKAKMFAYFYPDKRLRLIMKPEEVCPTKLQTLIGKMLR